MLQPEPQMHLSYHKSLSADRVSLLSGTSSFDDVVDMIHMATITDYVLELPTSERLKGLRRPSFLLDVCRETYDIFFNSTVGYRAQYAI